MSAAAKQTTIAQVIDQYGFSGLKRQILHEKDDYPFTPADMAICKHWGDSTWS
ncbi:hypothetical protein PTKU46_78290 [Paraburkholderia terrae]|uniref:hypothetical protein n=1 Tax=Paraburkholderia terrae TaxID=311230 RepID=UPI0030E5914E